MAYLTVKNNSDNIQKDAEIYLYYQKVMAGRLHLPDRVNPTC
jgi:hypothetical protein